MTKNDNQKKKAAEDVIISDSIIDEEVVYEPKSFWLSGFFFPQGIINL